MKWGNEREDKSIAVDPFGVLGIESHELVEKNVGHRGHAHRGARMAGVGLSRGIDLEDERESAIEANRRELQRPCVGGLRC